jgi:divalent metal cation (Fe/Co/Zn/Cd) transporter
LLGRKSVEASWPRIAAYSVVVASLAMAITKFWVAGWVFDGTAAIGIGLALAAAAGLRPLENRGLLTGKNPLQGVVKNLRRCVERTDGIIRVNRVLAMQLGPEKLLVTLDAAFDASTPERLRQTAERLEESIKRAHPYVRQVLIDGVRRTG